MNKLLNGSVIYRWLTAAAAWLDRQWDRSWLSVIVAGQKEGVRHSGILGSAGSLIHRALCAVFRFLRLDRALEGSIFGRTFFWCALTAALAPLIPTMATLGLTLICFVSLVVKFGTDRDARLFYSPVNKWIWIYAFIYIICTLTSVTLSGSLESGALTTVFIMFAIVLQNSTKKRKDIDRFISLLVAAGFLVAAYGFFQVITGAESAEAWVDSDSFSSITLRVYSTLDNPNVLGEYLLLIIPLGVSCAVTAKTFNGRLASVIATLAMLVCMILTYSRGGWLGLIFSAAIFLILVDRRFIVLGVAVLIVLPFVMPDTILARFTSIADLSDSSTSYRIYIWMATFNMLKDYWFCGIGTGLSAYGAVYPAYSFNAVSAPHSHNLFLQITCECGVCGIFAFLGMILSYIRTLGSKLRRSSDRKTRIQLIALISGMGGFLLQGMTDYSFYNYRVTLMFWIIVGLGILLAGMPSESTEAAR